MLISIVSSVGMLLFVVTPYLVLLDAFFDDSGDKTDGFGFIFMCCWALFSTCIIVDGFIESVKWLFT